MTNTTWNPSDKVGIDLSSGDLVATGHSFNFNGVRSTNPKLFSGSEKVYFEIACNGSFSDSRSLLGFADENAGIGHDPLTAANTAWFNEAGNTISVAGFDNTSVTLGPFSGQTFGVAIDIGNKKWWVTNNGSTWNAGGSADPATGVGDVFWTTQFTGSNLYIISTIIDAGASMTLNVGNSAFAYSVPSGFTAWDGVPPLTGVWNSTDTADTLSAIGYPGFPGSFGELVVTEAKDVFAAVGSPAVIGFFTVADTADRFSAFGFQPLTFVLSATEARDVMHATGVGLGEDGVFITTEAVDIFAAAGNTPVSGSFNAFESPDRFLAVSAGVTRVRRRRNFTVT